MGAKTTTTTTSTSTSRRSILRQSVLVLAALLLLLSPPYVDARKPPRRNAVTSRPSRRRGPPPSSSSKRPPPVARFESDEEYDEDEDGGIDDAYDDEDADADASSLLDDDMDDDSDDEPMRSSRKSKQPPPSSRRSSGGPPSRRKAPPSRSRRTNKPPPPPKQQQQRRRRPPVESEYDDDYEEEDAYDDFEEPSRRNSSGRRSRRSSRYPPPRRGGRVVPYTNQKPNSFLAFAQGVKKVLPDPAAVKNAAVSSFQTASSATSGLSSTLYREVKGLASSELEQVLLKSTRPDDTPVKGKHVERLVGVTYQISAQFDIYDAVLRKLWSKVTERDGRTKLKALYILHRFASDGSPQHASALKRHLRQLRRTRDPKQRKQKNVKYFNSKVLLAGDRVAPELQPFLATYAHYVLLRAQCFGGAFTEIGTTTDAAAAVSKSKSKRSKSKRNNNSPSTTGSLSNKPMTATCLRKEHYDAAALILKAGMAACDLRKKNKKSGAVCENTALAAERVASDLLALTAATAKALRVAITSSTSSKEDAQLIQLWCVLYRDELLPQTKAMLQTLSPQLDAFGLFLPSRVANNGLTADILERGLGMVDEKEEESASRGKVATDPDDEDGDEVDDEVDDNDTTAADATKASAVKEETPEEEEEEDAVEEAPAAADDEYEYEEEEYYDDEDE